MENSKKKSSSEAKTETQDASKAPIWDNQLHRVKAAMWKYDQKGKTRYTIALYRSYKDDDSGKWNNVHYFDPQDLPDIRTLIDEADRKVNQLAELV